MSFTVSNIMFKYIYNPLYFQCRKKTFSIKETVDEKQKTDTSECGFVGQAIGSKFVEKTVSFIKL